MQEFFQRVVYGNSLGDWLYAALAFILTFTVLPLLRGLVKRQAQRYDARELPVAVALLLHLMEHTSRLFLLTVALYFAERNLTLPGRSDRIADVVIVVSFWLQVGFWLMAAVRFGLTRRTLAEQDRQLAGTINIVTFVASLVVWTVAALLALENLGINVTALVAGLGVGGIAIALAVQAILGDLFASLSIALDKPFGVGDTLRVDDCEGTVEQIGIKSTRLRSVTGEQIVLANADLLKSRVRNFQGMQQRQASLALRISHATSTTLLEQIPRLVEAAVVEQRNTRFNHCLLKSLGESALEFEVVFQVLNPQGNDPAVALDRVNRAILVAFAAAGIALAHPMRTVEMIQR